MQSRVVFARRRHSFVGGVLVAASVALAFTNCETPLSNTELFAEPTYYPPTVLIGGVPTDLPPGDGLQFTGKVDQTFTQDGSMPHGTYRMTISGSGASGADGGLQVFNQASYDTTSGTAQSIAGFFSNTSAISAGTNGLQDYAVFGTSSGAGATAYAGFFDNGFVRVNGEALLTNVDASNVISEGYLQVNGTTDFEGHVFVNGAAPPSLSLCGDGTRQIAGDDNAGHVHFGAGAKGCTITFATPWSTRPACVVTNEDGAGKAGAYTVTTTAITYDANALDSIGDVDYVCFGVRAAPHFLSDAEILARLTPPPHVSLGFDGKPVIVPPTRAELDALAVNVRNYRIAHARLRQ